MAEQTRITGIYEIKIEQGPALRAFEEVKKRLDDTRAKIKDLNKENRDLIKAEQEVTTAIRANGTATTAQAKQLETIKRLRADTNKQVSEAVITEKALSAQTRELSNDLSGLTENSLRFRDKMALATTEALRQSGIIEQLSNREQELNKSLTTVTHTLESNETKLSELNIAYSKGEKSAEQYAAEQAALNKEIEAGKAANTVLAAELQQVSGKTDVLERQIHELNMELNAGKISAEQYRVGLSKIEEETRKAGMATSTLTDRFDSFVGSQGKELKSTLSSLALNYVGVGAAIYGVQNIIGGAIDTVVEFDKRLSSIRALGPEYASRIEDIGEAAKTAGINFGFTAAESLDAVEALAKAGVSVSDILGGALPGALTLAAAGEVSVAEAAETASKAMTQFGLAGEDIPKLADLLAAAAATATGDVGDFNQALNQAGLVASQLNIPIEEAIGTLTAFASAGLLGSDAGTSFRTMLLRLQNPTEESAELLKKYNIDAFDLMLGSSGINRGRWHIFFDRYQNIYGVDVQERVDKRLAEAQPAFDDLFENCRNTRQVAVQASIVSGIDLAIEGAPEGPECENVYYRDRKSFLVLLEATVARLVKQDIRPQDIAVLSTRARDNSLVAGVQELAGVPLVDAASAHDGDMIFSTMHAFKGLERLVVLAIDADGIGDPERSMLHYAGLSRARGLLHVFLPETSRAAYGNQAAAFAARMAGQASPVTVP